MLASLYSSDAIPWAQLDEYLEVFNKILAMSEYLPVMLW